MILSDNTYIDEQGVTYSINRKVLIKGNSSLVNYKVLSGTEIINDLAFYNCKNLCMVELPDTITKIGDNAFGGCSNLSGINLPISLDKLYGNSFQECENLRILKIPKSTTIIGALSFHGCNSLEYVTIPESVTEIDGGAFMFCRMLRYVIIHNGIIKIGHSAFKFCENLCCITTKEVNIDRPNLNESEYRKIKYFITPNSLKEIGECAFYGCDSLRNIIISSSKLSIKKNAFGSLQVNGAVSINIFIPIGSRLSFINFVDQQVCKFHEYSNCHHIISECEDSTSINSLDFLYSKRQSDGSIISLDGNRLLSGPENCTTYIIPESVKYICDGAFFRREKLIEVIIPTSVKKIGKSAFDHCHKLEFVNLHEDLISLGSRSFACCYNLKSIHIPNHINEIPDRCFYYCKNLTSINIGTNIKRILKRAFYCCYKLHITFIDIDTEEAKQLLKYVDMPHLWERSIYK